MTSHVTQEVTRTRRSASSGGHPFLAWKITAAGGPGWMVQRPRIWVSLGGRR